MFEVWTQPNEEHIDKEPFRTRIHRKGVGIIEMISFDDHTDMYCPHCKAAGFQVKLTNKILMPGETRQPDYENWMQCPDCYEVVAAYVIEHDATIIRDDIPTVETPFENTSEIMGLPKRTSRAGIKARKQRNKPHHKDPEIQREIDQHGINNVNVIYDSNA